MASFSWQQPWALDKFRPWPAEIAAHLQKWLLSERSPGFLVTDAAVRVVSTGGELARYGLGELRQGESALQQAYFLEGLLPLDGSVSTLCRVETTAGIFADIHLFHIQEGDCTLVLDASNDVAERTRIEQALRQAEEQLRQSEKMEALGRLVGGVAHDFNNLLTIILGYSHILMDASLEERHHAAADEIRGAADKAAEMTRHLLSFSRRQSRHVDVIDLNELIARLHSLLRRLIREDILLNIKTDPALAFVEADAGQIEQVLMNLVANARDAMPGGGVLEIATANIEVDEEYLSARPNTQLHLGPHVRLTVLDSGCGMDAETMEKAFEPFFTSKESGHGTGLGLAIVYGIIYHSSGDIFLTSRVGAGTRVEILLPAVRKLPSAIHADPDQRLARGSETILLVEDEDAVRRLVRELLAELGYQVLESADPDAALALCRGHAGKIDLLMTDFVMPRMNGSELAERILAAHPETRVLYMSGYMHEAPRKGDLDFRESVFLGKPFTPGILADRVREALGCAPAPRRDAAD